MEHRPVISQLEAVLYLNGVGIGRSFILCEEEQLIRQQAENPSRPIVEQLLERMGWRTTCFGHFRIALSEPIGAMNVCSR